jgi:hypothetical protein
MNHPLIHAFGCTLLDVFDTQPTWCSGVVRLRSAHVCFRERDWRKD